jgi:hypothetical protein
VKARQLDSFRRALPHNNCSAVPVWTGVKDKFENSLTRFQRGDDHGLPQPRPRFEPSGTAPAFLTE